MRPDSLLRSVQALNDIAALEMVVEAAQEQIKRIEARQRSLVRLLCPVR